MKVRGQWEGVHEGWEIFGERNYHVLRPEEGILDAANRVDRVLVLDWDFVPHGADHVAPLAVL